MLWRASLSDDANERQQFIAAAEHCHAHNVRFPNSLDEVQMLQSLGDSAFARYLLGCFWYSKRRYDEAVSCWRETLEKSPDYAPAHRLLGVYSWNKQQDATHALAYLQRAVALEPDNARFLFELDFLQKLLARPVHERLTTLVERKAVVLKRDDLTAELLSLWNASGHYADAAAILDTRVFHPWEGGEGKITGQYLLNQLHRALQFIERGAFKQATDCLKAALRYPTIWGEGRLPGQTDNDIWYLLGYCAEQAGGCAAGGGILPACPARGLNAGRRAVLQRSTRRLPFLAGHCAA
ncbi:putative transferase [Klebsiella pneumoniae]|nr:putative transferase [Klebsiella pneumoniae]